MIKCIYTDEEENPIRIKCDATKIDVKSYTKPDLARNAVIYHPPVMSPLSRRGRVHGDLECETV